MSINSRQKGKAGEREWVGFLKEQGFQSARRTQQFCGTAGDADVECEDLKLHWEVKRCQQFRIEDWMAQARSDSRGTGKLPVVAFRKNNGKWLCTMDAEDFFNLIKEPEVYVL